MMRKSFLALCGALALAGCATIPREAPTARPVEVALIALNDFHGNLEPPRRAITAPADAQGPEVQVPAGGAAYLAAAIETLRARHPNHLVVSAGDLVSASPLTSSLFLDEPSILAMNLMRLDFNAVGNHEFDRGRAELLRLDRGGCERHTARTPCAIDPAFPGADFAFLAANVLTEDGATLLPAQGIRSFGTGANRVQVAVIGMTLKDTPTLVSPDGIAGLSFRDEAETVNALIPQLKAAGADAIVVLIHQGLSAGPSYNAKTCDGVTGDLTAVLQRLSPEVDVVVSGHTHQSYICDYGTIDPTRPFLVTSAGSYGTLVTEIRLTIDPRRGVTARTADNHIVQSGAYRGSRGEVVPTDRFPRYTPEPRVAALVERYRLAARPLAERVVGSLSAPALREKAPSGESPLGNLVADAQLAAVRAQGAQVAFANSGGLRADLVPAADGSVTYGQIYAAQPFGNTLAIRTLTGRQLKALLEQQWNSGSNTVEQPQMLSPSAGFSYAYDLSRPPGERVSDLRLNGTPIADDAVLRVVAVNFLMTGGDNFTAFAAGTDTLGGPLDLDALEAYLAANPRLTPPATDRIRNLTPAP
jgi:5'-nucleotidase